MFWTTPIHILMVLLSYLLTVHAQTTVKVSLKKYLNFGNLLWNGDKCTRTDDYCPKILEFCVKEFPPPPTTFGSCLYYNKTKASTSNVIDFELTPTDIDQNIELKISSYTGIGIIMNITKGSSLLDPGLLIDTHMFGQHFLPGYNGTIRQHSRVSFGQRATSKSRLSFTVKVSCNQHYYDDKCNTYCKSTDDSAGHYTCDSAGNRVCNRNWYKLPNCLTYCFPHDDDVNGHYTCTINGTRICRPKWYVLPNCTIHCEPKDDNINGHYTCDKYGRRMCRKNWYNHPKCDTCCAPQNDSINGYYTCDNNGTRICRKHWHNLPHCDTYCVAQNNSVHGYYSCSINGTHICHPGWYNLPNCTTFCIPMDDDLNGHYTCETNGLHKCRHGWFNPPNCTSRLVTPIVSASSSLLGTLQTASIHQGVMATHRYSSSYNIFRQTRSKEPSSEIYISASHSWILHASRASSLSPIQNISATQSPSTPPRTEVKKWWLWFVETDLGIAVLCIAGGAVLSIVSLACGYCFCRSPARSHTRIRTIKVVPQDNVEMRGISKQKDSENERSSRNTVLRFEVETKHLK